MATVIYLDTHIVVWLFIPRLDLFSDSIKDLLSESNLLISPMVLLELEYLLESGRINKTADVIYQSLNRSIGLTCCDLPFPGVVQAARRQTWTRDPFDRVIAGQAIMAGKQLVTKDRTIREHFKDALWS